MPSYNPVYSTQLIAYTDSAPNNVYEVPEGFTAIIRYASYFESSGAGYADVYIQDSPTAPGITVIALEVTGVNQLQHADLRVVVPGGGLITLFEGALGSGPQVYVGGYLLRDTLT